MNNQKKEKMAVIVGFSAIFLVIIFTLFREKIFSDSAKIKLDSKSKSTSTQNSLPYQTISAKDLNKKILGIGGKEPLTLLDIRSFDLYIAEHIVDSINMTPDEIQAKSNIDIHKSTIIIAENGKDEKIQKAIEKLQDLKVTNITVLAGGMEAWKEQIGDTVTYGNPKSFTDQSKVSYTDPEKLNEAIAQNVPVYIIDVRTNEQYSDGHIKGATNIPFDDLEKRRKEILEKKVVVVGESELQEFQASVQIYDMLLVSPFVVRGAMPEWQKKGFPVIK